MKKKLRENGNYDYINTITTQDAITGEDIISNVVVIKDSNDETIILNRDRLIENRDSLNLQIENYNQQLNAELIN